jgi:hypothetical protein
VGLPYHEKGLRSWNYISSAQSEYHIWFQELGYPQLDITRYEDGEWCIIQYLHTPLIPSECKYRTVLSGLRNIEISYSFIERYLDEINPQSARFWRNVEADEKRIDGEFERDERNAIDRASRAQKHIIQNPDLMNRIAKFGLKEMDPWNIRKHIPNSKF